MADPPRVAPWSAGGPSRWLIDIVEILIHWHSGRPIAVVGREPREGPGDHPQVRGPG